MSFDIKLTAPDNTLIVEEDQVIEDDKKTVILNRPMNNVTTIKVRINDFERDRNQQTEILIREDVTDQFDGNTDTIFVKQGPIFDGLKIGNLATNENDVVVRIKIEDEDVSGQLTGIENFFILEGRPLLKNNNYDFTSVVSRDDVVVKINGDELASNEVVDVNSSVGRIQLENIPLITDVVTVSYFFRAKIKTLDAGNSKIVLKEKPKLGQEVKVQYNSKVNDGWDVQLSQRSLIENARDIIFFRNKNTNRIRVEDENISSQFTGTERTFNTFNFPLLPLFQNFSSTIVDTLNNAVIVTINGIRVPVESISSEIGRIRLFQRPLETDIVLVTYFFESELITDRISIDYSVSRLNSLKHTRNPDLADYQIDKLGNYKKVENEEKLIQDLKKIIITRRESDPVATWYGTNFEKIIGTKQFPEFTITRISGEIIEALTRLKNAQIQQEEYQELTPEEFLDFVQNIEVEQDITDTSFFKATVDVVTQAGTLRPVEEIPIIFDDQT